MKVKVENWPISKILELRNEINEQPAYQRGAVWSSKKQKILIDSILRGIDIPKIYLRTLLTKNFKYEVADGQQRLTAIWEFYSGKEGTELEAIDDNGLDLSKVNGINVVGKNFNSLSKGLQAKFLNYELTVALVKDATNEEIRTLFGRLQMGSSLNTAEKRNAIISAIGYEVDLLAFNHEFFINSKINKSRFKHQDYIAHALALAYFKNKTDLKADLILKMYMELRIEVPNDLILDAALTLDYLKEIDPHINKRLVNKWSFVDTFWLIFRNLHKIDNIDFAGFGKEFSNFESKRIEFFNKADELIEGKEPTTFEKDLFTYLNSYKTEGSSHKKIKDRSDVFQRVFDPYIKFKK